MAMKKNKYGLTRTIPASVKREVRKRSKFGCIVCRNAIYEYEHIEPPWFEARVHDPCCICLLCGACHDKVTKGHLSKQTVLESYKKVQSDSSVERPFSDFDLRSNPLVIKIGECEFTHSRAIFTIDGVDLLSFVAPEDGIGLPQLNGIFCDHQGRRIFEVRNNEWFGPLDCWDVKIVGKKITIHTDNKRISLELAVSPPNKIEIVRLDMRLGSTRVAVEDLLILERQYDDRIFRLGIEADCVGSDSCIYINSKSPRVPVYKELRMTGGRGVELLDCGIVIGKGSGQSWIKKIRLS